MRKKFFSALLFGTLAVVSTGSLVSCKDYDDDISNLQKQIDELNKLVKAIQGQIDDGAILTSVTPITNGITVKLSNGQTYDIVNGEKGDAGVDGTVWKIGDNGNWWSSTGGADFVDTGMPSRGANGKDGADGKDGKDGIDGTNGKDGADGKDGKDGIDGTNGKDGADGKDGKDGIDGTNGKDGKYYVPNAQTGTFWVYNDGDKAAYDSGVSYVSATTVTAIWSEDKLTLNNVSGATDGKVEINLTSELKSLVFSPEFYYGGIEALDVASFKYKPLTVAPVNANDNKDTDAPTAASSYFTYAPELHASYFLNPSNAKIDAEDSTKYKFLAYDKAYSRAVSGTDFTVTKAKKSNGLVTVYASYKGEEIKKLSDDKVTVIALQYTDNDNTVTSDFAALRNTNWQDLALNNPKGGVNNHTTGDDHLYTTAAAAISADANVEVAWDKTIDLRDYVNTDRVKEGTTTCVAWDANAKAGTVEKTGFKYKFELVGYESGTNHTKQSVHAAIADDGFTLRPQMPKDGRQQAYGAEQNKATVDKEPLVRVQLVDTVNAKVAAVGYFKVKIVLIPTPDVVNNPTLEMPQQTKDYTLTCGDANYLTQNLNWNNVEENIIAKLNMSKNDFHNTYELVGSANDATQFNSNGTQATTKIGVVSQTTADVDGTQTQVLQWVVKNQEAYTAFKAGKTELVTYVCYQHKTNSNSKLFLKFSWKPGQINITPSTSYSDDNKIKMYWYALNNPVAGTGKDEIHGNVEVVGSTNNDVNGAATAAADDEFVFNIKNTLVGGQLKVANLAAPYAGLNGSLLTTFAFASGHGLYANSDGDALYAEASLTNKVATLDQTSGIVTLNDNAVAKRLLNAHGHTTTEELAACLTAKVKVVAKVCSGINVPVSDNEFDVKFIRPISVTSASATFTDAAADTQKLNLTFKDWRNMGFTDSNRVPSTADFFAYYGIKEITLDKANATTDLNGNSGNKLSAVAPKIKIDYNPAAGNGTQIVAGDYGTITYQNLGNTVGTFHIDIPGTVTYDWGELPITVKVTVNGTVSSKRH